jgi:F-type H+-transporting ATPase subunit a
VSSQIEKTVNIISAYLEAELGAVFGALVIPGTLSVFVTFFIFIVFSNFIGLCPYVFTSSRHLSITLTLALPLWLGRILQSLGFQFNRLIAHLVPSGTPGALIPIIVIIERVRNIIRPGTLAIRLAANMVAGHLLLTLLGGQGPNVRGLVFLCLIVALILLLILEVAVACIQAYVFTVLSSLYLNELRRSSFNKLIV